MDLQTKIFANILILSLLISFCSGQEGHRKLTAFVDDEEVASYSATEQDLGIVSDVNRRLVEVVDVLDYEKAGSNPRHQPGKGRGPKPRF
uniref:Uncharacterized protein n=1 Tax=Kalanchoe fedtschenkoi TaxID=63787 RepID=A0A7N0UKG4_KALFE